MKKFLAMLLVCVSALSVLAFGGCGLLSDTLTGISGNENGNSESESGGNENGGTVSYEVSEDEWRAAFGTDRMLNLTIQETYDYEQISYSFVSIYKYALTDNASYVSGKTYYYADENYDDDEYIEEGYVSYSSSSTETVIKDTINGSIQWYGEKTTEPATLSDASSYYYVVPGSYTWFYLLENETNSETDTIDAYSLFTYENGAYIYTEEFDDGTITITAKFSNGYISYMSIEYNITRSSGEFEAGDYIIYSATFSDYGATTVTVPNEYTYDYYLANNA